MALISAHAKTSTIDYGAPGGREWGGVLLNNTKVHALQILGHTSFGLIEDPKSPCADDGSVVDTQNPLANTNAPRGSSIVVTSK